MSDEYQIKKNSDGSLEVTAEAVFFDNGSSGGIMRTGTTSSPDDLLGRAAKQGGYRHSEKFRYKLIIAPRQSS